MEPGALADLTLIADPERRFLVLMKVCMVWNHALVLVALR
jgi:hypothetical protein